MSTRTEASTEVSAIREMLFEAQPCLTAAVALILYEHAITLSHELRTMWKGRPTSVSIFFFLNRYIILAWSICNILLLVPINHNGWYNKSYEMTLVCEEVFSIAWQCIWAVFGATRVYAVSNRSWLLASLTLALGLVWPITTSYIYARRSPSNSSSTSSGKLSVPGNTVSSALTDKIVIATHTCLIASDVIVLYVTWISMIKLRRARPFNDRVMSLVTFFCRDGTIHFMLLLLLNCLQMGLYVSGACEALSVIVTPLSSIIISRFLLGIRECRLSPETDLGEGLAFSVNQESHSMTTVYLSTFVGSMGAPLNHDPWLSTDSDFSEDDATPAGAFTRRRESVTVDDMGLEAHMDHSETPR